MHSKAELLHQEQTDLGTAHHFSDGVYAKEMHLPAGHVALSHKHSYSHLSILAKGKCVVYFGSEESVKEYSAPAIIEILAGVQHEIVAVEDVSWFCIHATGETDVQKIDEVAIAPVQ